MRDKAFNRIIMMISALFAFFYYGLGFMVNYGPDIYWAIDNPRRQISAMFHGDGRWMNALIYMIFRHEGQPYHVFYHISFVASLILVTLAIFMFGSFLAPRLSQRLNIETGDCSVIIAALISCITVANLFSAEYFLYPDQTIAYMLSILLNVIAVKEFVIYMEKKGGIRRLLSAFLCLFLCVFMAEVIASIFVILTIPFILMYSEDIKSFIVKQVTAGLLYGTALISKLLFTRFFVRSERANNESSSVVTTVSQYTPQGKTPQAYVLDRITFGMWTYMIICLLVVVILTVLAIRKKRSFEIIKGIYMVFATVILGTLPYIFRFTNNYVPRIYYPLGTLAGVLTIYGLLSGLIDIGSIRLKRFVTGVIVVLAGVQWLSFVQMFTDQYITNYDDKIISEMIGERIEKYENESGNTIDRVTFYSDSIRTKYARDEGWCLSQRGYDATWSKLETLNFYLKKNYQPGTVDSRIAEDFIQKNWDTYSPDQIIFEDNTAHICTF